MATCIEVHNEKEYSPRIQRSECALLLRQQVHRSFHRWSRHRHRSLLLMPPILHWQAEDRWYRWSRWGIQEALWYARRSKACLIPDSVQSNDCSQKAPSFVQRLGVFYCPKLGICCYPWSAHAVHCSLVPLPSPSVFVLAFRTKDHSTIFPSQLA